MGIKKEIKNLFFSTKVLIDKGKQIEKLKGEKFNLFTIMNMEDKEVNTHSAFINELLDSNGSHLMGDVFLKLFIKMLQDKGVLVGLNSYLNTRNSFSQKEKYISKVDYVKQTGGSIDIFVSDNNNSISIENKINAIDQPSQMVRYYKYNTHNNLLLYLTLDGSDVNDENSIIITTDYKPRECETVEFKNKLIVGCHYHLISYKNDISKWLNNCLKESSDNPILRESIKQYLILVKKLTNTMDKNEQNELEDLIINNRDAAKFISNNYKNAINKVRDNLRKSVIEKLKEALGNDYVVVEGNPFPHGYTQIWINYKKENQKLCFGIETFSGGRKIFMGMFKENTNELIYENKVKSKKGDYWVEDEIEYLNFDLDLYNSETLMKLHKNNGEISNKIVIQFIKYKDKWIDFVKDINGVE